MIESVSLQKRFLGKRRWNARRKNRFKDLIGLNSRRSSKKVIGLIGLSRGVGTSHLSLMLGNYLVNVLGIKTAIVCFDDGSLVDLLKQIFDRKSNSVFSKNNEEVEKFRGITHNGIDIFSHRSCENWRTLTNTYQYVIIDISVSDYNYSKAVKDFVSCDKKIIVGSMTPYKLNECIERFKRIKTLVGKEELSVVSMTYNKEEAKALKESFGVTIKAIPYEQDLRVTNGSNLKWLDELIFAQKIYHIQFNTKIK
ncbi:hypothetical protein [Lachnospira multipara]|uniref:hypothetical protein n=1 Tax=Lachnospira multipara TaxID=28051 RepID=UPI000480D9B7|nr:hypothetical protein [Lachnospira multipara]